MQEEKKLIFTSGRYRLYRLADGAGDSGGILLSLDKETANPKGENGEVILGCPVMCGSHYARSFSSQDWWLCTAVKEILETGHGWAKVRTQSNRDYLVGDLDAVSQQIKKAAEKTQERSAT